MFNKFKLFVLFRKGNNFLVGKKEEAKIDQLYFRLLRNGYYEDDSLIANEI